MSVWGESYSRFKSVSKSPGTTVDLRVSILRPTWTEPQLIQHQSVLTGARSYTKLCDDLGTFEVIVNIWKLGGGGKSAMQSILNYNHDTVNFMPHVDVDIYLQAVGGGDANFYIELVQPFYLSVEPPLYYDKCLVRLVSLEPLDLINSMPL